jgi:hypothetical protein
MQTPQLPFPGGIPGLSGKASLVRFDWFPETAGAAFSAGDRLRGLLP